MLADAVVHLPAVGVRDRLRQLILQLGPGVAGEIGCARHQCRHGVERRIERLLDRDPGGDRLAVGERGECLLPAGQTCRMPGGIPQRGIDAGRVVPLAPGGHLCVTAAGAVGPVRSDQVVRRPERLVRDAHHGLGAGDVLGGERVAVGVGVVGEVGARESDVAAQDEQARAVGLGHATTDAGLERIEVVGDLAELIDVPSVGLETLGDVVAVREVRVAVDGDVVVVVDAHESAETQMAGE